VETAVTFIFKDDSLARASFLCAAPNSIATPFGETSQGEKLIQSAPPSHLLTLPIMFSIARSKAFFVNCVFADAAFSTRFFMIYGWRKP
jgi:hypothetical protein